MVTPIIPIIPSVPIAKPVTQIVPVNLTKPIVPVVPPVIKVNLDTNFLASAARLTELRKNRDVGNIPLTDEYWIALKNHNKYFGVNK